MNGPLGVKTINENKTMKNNNDLNIREASHKLSPQFRGW
jgi:hypothetical protein